jgi:hypothetical protein
MHDPDCEVFVPDVYDLDLAIATGLFVDDVDFFFRDVRCGL